MMKAEIKEKLIKVINSCENNDHLRIAYRYYMQATKYINHNDALIIFSSYYMTRRNEINAPVVK